MTANGELVGRIAAQPVPSSSLQADSAPRDRAPEGHVPPGVIGADTPDLPRPSDNRPLAGTAAAQDRRSHAKTRAQDPEPRRVSGRRRDANPAGARHGAVETYPEGRQPSARGIGSSSSDYDLDASIPVRRPGAETSALSADSDSQGHPLPGAPGSEWQGMQARTRVAPPSGSGTGTPVSAPAKLTAAARAWAGHQAPTGRRTVLSGLRSGASEAQPRMHGGRAEKSSALRRRSQLHGSSTARTPLTRRKQHA